MEAGLEIGLEGVEQRDGYVLVRAGGKLAVIPLSFVALVEGDEYSVRVVLLNGLQYTIWHDGRRVQDVEVKRLAHVEHLNSCSEG